MTVNEEVKKIIRRITRKPDAEIAPETTFADLKADSLDIVQVMAAIEDMYDIELEEEGLQHLTNLGEFIAFVEKAVKEKD